MITSDAVRKRHAERAAARTGAPAPARPRDAYLDGHGSAQQPAVRGDDFLSGAARPAIAISKSAQLAIGRSWGVVELVVVRIVRRGAADEVVAVRPDEMPALEATLGDDPTVECIECERGPFEVGDDE